MEAKTASKNLLEKIRIILCQRTKMVPIKPHIPKNPPPMAAAGLLGPDLVPRSTYVFHVVGVVTT